MYCLAALQQALHRCNQNCGILLMKASTAAEQHSSAVIVFGGGKLALHTASQAIENASQAIHIDCCRSLT